MKKNHKIYDEYNTDFEIAIAAHYKSWNEKWLIPKEFKWTI